MNGKIENKEIFAIEMTKQMIEAFGSDTLISIQTWILLLIETDLLIPTMAKSIMDNKIVKAAQRIRPTCN